MVALAREDILRAPRSYNQARKTTRVVAVVADFIAVADFAVVVAFMIRDYGLKPGRARLTPSAFKKFVVI